MTRFEPSDSHSKFFNSFSEAIFAFSDSEKFKDQTYPIYSWDVSEV